MARTRGSLEIDGRTVPVSNLDKVLYPQAAFTKADIIAYYIDVADAILPHLRGRPLTLKRYPEGVKEPFFYQKNAPAHRPRWVKTVAVPTQRRVVHYLLANDLPTLVWAANLAALELHVSLASAKTPHRPDLMVFDLDPGPPAGLAECCRVALALRRCLKRDGLDAYPKTSGIKGLQVYVPLNAPRITFAHTKDYAKRMAESLTRKMPDLVLPRMSKALRTGKVFIDWSQNDPKKTTVCVYSLRAVEIPSVSTPVTWEEVERAAVSGDASRLRFGPPDVLYRLNTQGDLFNPLTHQIQRLPR